MIYTTIDTVTNVKTYTCSDGVIFTVNSESEDNRIEVQLDAMTHELEYILGQIKVYTTTVYNILEDWEYWTSASGPKQTMDEVFSNIDSENHAYLFVFKPKGDIDKANNAVKLLYDYFMVAYQLNGIYKWGDWKYGEPLPRREYGRFERIDYNKVDLTADDVFVMYMSKPGAFDDTKWIHISTTKVLLWQYDIKINNLQGKKRIFESMINQIKDIGMGDSSRYANY